MRDPIERQDAIEAMTNTLWHYPNECYRNLNEYEFAKGLAELGLKSVPSAQQEITEDDVKEYCRKRCLIVVASDFYDEMTRRWASAQPEIVRCKDCKHFKRNIPCVGGFYDGCDELIDDGNEMFVEENFYCGYAERRADE